MPALPTGCFENVADNEPDPFYAKPETVKAAPAEGQADEQAFQQQVAANAAEWNALKKSHDDARIAAYAPLEARRKALAGRL